jgi:hypothetical protein
MADFLTRNKYMDTSEIKIQNNRLVIAGVSIRDIAMRESSVDKLLAIQLLLDELSLEIKQGRRPDIPKHWTASIRIYKNALGRRVAILTQRKKRRNVLRAANNAKNKRAGGTLDGARDQKAAQKVNTAITKSAITAVVRAFTNNNAASSKAVNANMTNANIRRAMAIAAMDDINRSDKWMENIKVRTEALIAQGLEPADALRTVTKPVDSAIALSKHEEALKLETEALDILNKPSNTEGQGENEN